ncbi:MAG: AtpZ/AtpI family protein [Proteobacteria bacterium]|nr:AtpZ/AtpI family protein [Pseudomonadota bacterium]
MDEETKKTMVQTAYVSSLGFAMVIASVGGFLVGAYLDRKLGTGYKLALLFFLIGTIAGFRNVYVAIKKHFKDEIPIVKRLKYEPHRKRPAPEKT